MNKFAGKMTLLGFAVICLVVVVQGKFCPDKQTRCGDKQTCCSTNTGSYGCCPYNAATCCSDGTHCCPHGSDCDIAHGRCVPRRNGWTLIYDAFSQEELKMLGDNSLIVDTLANATTTNVGKDCPGGGQSCPDSYTCCSLASGGYGCCPYKGATCCKDHIHCCPHGQQCDDQKRQCV